MKTQKLTKDEQKKLALETSLLFDLIHIEQRLIKAARLRNRLMRHNTDEAIAAAQEYQRLEAEWELAQNVVPEWLLELKQERDESKLFSNLASE